MQLFVIALEKLREMRRASFFFAFKDEPKIDWQLHLRDADRIQRREHADDWRLVVTSRTRVEAPLGID